MFRRADAGHILDALRQHADERAAGGVALAVDGKFADGKMALAGFDHACFKRRRPGGHAIPENRLRFGLRQRARAVAVALGSVFDDFVLIRPDQLALLPDRRAHGAVGVNRVVGPVAARIGKVKAPGKCPGDDAAAVLAGEQLGVALDAFKITGPAVQEKKADLLAVGAGGDFARVRRLVHDHAHVPIHAEHVDAENIFAAGDRNVGQAQDLFGVFDALFAGDEFRWLPLAHVGFSYYVSRSERFGRFTAEPPSTPRGKS